MTQRGDLFAEDWRAVWARRAFRICLAGTMLGIVTAPWLSLLPFAVYSGQLEERCGAEVRERFGSLASTSGSSTHVRWFWPSWVCVAPNGEEIDL